MQIKEIEQNVELIELNGKEIYLIGTAHVSKASAELVEKVIKEQQPDTVCIELCKPRFESLNNAQRWKDTNIFEVIKTGKAYLLMAQLALAAFQKRIADELGIRPGEEMRRAIETSNEVNAKLSCVDREVRTTLKRAWAKASLWSMIKVTASIIASLFTKEKLSEEEIEKLKLGDDLTAMMTEFSDHLPGVKTALIDERDSYMAQKIVDSPGSKLVAVVGAGHVPGIKRQIGEQIDIAELESIPPPRSVFKIIGWGVPILIIGLFTLGFFISGKEASLQLVLAWVLANGTLSALGALIAFAHPLTIITAFIAAPITSLNPMIAAGWVAGLTEALVRKPKVKDLESVAEDITSLKGIWHNGVTRVLLVVALANLGSTVGSFVGVGAIFWILQEIGILNV